MTSSWRMLYVVTMVSWVSLAILLTCIAMASASFGAEPADKRPSFTSSNKKLDEAFAWARSQALSYAREGDPVGPWYEAALPGRSAFCIRDVCHQAYGGQALGLDRHTYNMLHKFAQSVAESRDWCGFWEIDNLDRPAPVDYTNDQDFWYNLPASFDLLDCCWRMYVWTGDRRYLDEPAFREFYRRTMTSYIERWGLHPDKVMTRTENRHKQRGIPSYVETEGGFRVAVDVLFAQLAAYRSYISILEAWGEKAEAEKYRRDMKKLASLVDEKWWESRTKSYYGFLMMDGSMSPGDRWYSTYWDVLPAGPKLEASVKRLVAIPLQQDAYQVEDKSYYPEIFFRYGFPGKAVQQILDLTKPGRERREYPEVSFALVGAMARGLMGIAPLTRADGSLALETLACFPKGLGRAEMTGVSVLGSTVDVRHTSTTETTLTNHGNRPLIWRPTFAGRYKTISAGGRDLPTTTEKRNLDRTVTHAEIEVQPGQTITAKARA